MKMENKKLIEELEEKFKKTSEKLKIKTSLDDLDGIFHIRDHVLKEGFVSNDLLRQVCYRIIETYMGWSEYLHSLIMPNPQNIINISESKVLSQDDKKEITELIKKVMELASRNSVIALTKDQKAEGELISDGKKLWESEFKPRLVRIMTKINGEWRKTK